MFKQKQTKIARKSVNWIKSYDGWQPDLGEVSRVYADFRLFSFVNLPVDLINKKATELLLKFCS